MILLGSLFVITGGIFLEGDLQATPATNAAFLGGGALLASIIGTTGASMLLVRPLLQTNRERRHVTHTVVFFIFLVSNVGGCLTPLGDPPLFLGYLAGVPFTWTLRLAPAWLFVCGALLALYFLWDRRAYAREDSLDLMRDRLEIRPLRMAGKENIGLLLAVVAAVALLKAPYREAAMVGAALLSLLVTQKELRRPTASRLDRFSRWRLSSWASSSPCCRLSTCSGHAAATWAFTRPGTSSGPLAPCPRSSTMPRRT